jgi:N-acetylneuraminic acid mutarotase
VIFGGYNTTKKKASAAVWRLNLCDLRWEPIATLAHARVEHTCCTVRGNVVVLGGEQEPGMQSTVEVVKFEPSTGKNVVSALPQMWSTSGSAQSHSP